MGAIAELPNYEVVALKYATRGRPISSAATRTMCDADGLLPLGGSR